MQEKLSYKNKKGESFTIEISDANLQNNDNFFAYNAKVIKIDDNWVHEFVINILKRTANTKELSDLFLQGEPLNYLYKLLEKTDQDIQLYWPDLSNGWEIR